MAGHSDGHFAGARAAGSAEMNGLPDLSNDELLVLKVALSDGSLTAPAAPQAASHASIAIRTKFSLEKVGATIARLKAIGWLK